jgi:hypothetical protein
MVQTVKRILGKDYILQRRPWRDSPMKYIATIAPVVETVDRFAAYSFPSAEAASTVRSSLAGPWEVVER